MYEKEIEQAAFHLSRRDDDPKKKADRQYVERTAELFDIFAQLGFGEWTSMLKNYIERKDKTDRPRVTFVGKELASGDAMEVELYNAYNRCMPKDLTFRLSYQNGRAIAVGQHCGTMRFTDLRNMRSYYDGFVWAASRLNGQLWAEKEAQTLRITPSEIEAHIAAATIQMNEHGIDNIQHALLPAPGGDKYRQITMKPYLVGAYGDMPVAININYIATAVVQITFYMVSASGLCVKQFGYVNLDRSGKVEEVKVDIGKLLARD